MKRMLQKSALATSVVLLAMGSINTAQAHCFNSKTLGTAAKAADLYQVMCFNNGAGAPARLSVIPNLTAGGSGVMVTVAKPTNTPVTASDTSNGAAITLASCTGASLGTTATLNGGSGNYDILVQKASTTSDVTAKTYGLVFHCETSGGLETGTAEVHSGTAGEIADNVGLSPDIDHIIEQ